jgi:hypothetical protein
LYQKWLLQLVECNKENELTNVNKDCNVGSHMVADEFGKKHVFGCCVSLETSKFGRHRLHEE